MNQRILVNDWYLYRPWTGVATYLANVLANWPGDAVYAPIGAMTHRFLRRKAFPNPGHTSRATNMPAESLTLKPIASIGGNTATDKKRKKLWRTVARKAYNTLFKLAASRRRYAICWEPNHLVIRNRLKTVATMHDLSVLEHPQWHPADRVREWEKQLPIAIKDTQHWIADAQFTARRMQERLGIASERITVIPLAARGLPYPTRDQIASRLKTAGLNWPYFVALGTIEPRKNLKVLLDAWALLPTEVRASHRLIFAGAPGWGDPAYWRSLAEHPVADEVLMTGYISHEHVALLLAGAVATLSSSHYEGFGLPLVEAMACSSPVLASDIPTYREVSGDAVCLLDPDDPSAWAGTIRRAIEDSAWRTDLGNKGFEHGRRYSWELTAKRHADVLASIARQ